VPTRKANKAIKPGIQTFQRNLSLDPVRKRPRVFFMADALVERDEELANAGRPTCTIEEFGVYQWDPVLDMPKDKDNHGMDTGRYVQHTFEFPSDDSIPLIATPMPIGIKLKTR
jgi:phage terminase large subunit